MEGYCDYEEQIEEEDYFNGGGNMEREDIEYQYEEEDIEDDDEDEGNIQNPESEGI